MMYEELYQYFILHKELSVPGIGTFLLQRKPATMDFPNKKLEGPAYAITLSFPAFAPSSVFFGWLAKKLGISDREAVIRFNDFAFNMKKEITEGDIIDWKGIGVLNKGLAGEVKFSPSEKIMMPERAVIAKKVIREKADHMVRVGEDEKTSAEMTELLSHNNTKRTYWWTWALIAGLLAVMFLGWYFSEHGITVNAAGNNSSLSPQDSAATYHLVP